MRLLPRRATGSRAAPSQKATFPTRPVGICPELPPSLQTSRQEPGSFTTIYGCCCLTEMETNGYTVSQLVFSSSIKTAPLFIRGTEGCGSSLDIHLRCFQFGAFTRKAGRVGLLFQGTHLRETAWALRLGPPFLVCRTRGPDTAHCNRTSDPHCVS